MKTPLDIAIQIVGGQSALAAKVGVKQGHVWYWLNRQGGMSPAEKVISVCQATDWQVTPHELRPDIYPNHTDGIPLDRAADFVERRDAERRAAERREQERRDHERRGGGFPANHNPEDAA